MHVDGLRKLDPQVLLLLSLIIVFQEDSKI